MFENRVNPHHTENRAYCDAQYRRGLYRCTRRPHAKHGLHRDGLFTWDDGGYEGFSWPDADGERR